MENSTRLSNVRAWRMFMRTFGRLKAVADRALSKTDLKPTQSNILIELNLYPKQTHRQLANSLGMQPGQVSKAVQSLMREELVLREPTRLKNQVSLSLSQAGRIEAEKLDRLVDQAIDKEHADLPPLEQENLARYWVAPEGAAPGTSDAMEIKLRAMKADDVGWLIAQLTDDMPAVPWRERYVAEVASNISRFLTQPTFDRTFLSIACLGTQRAGACLLMIDPDALDARIELLFVARQTRRLGIASQLVEKALKLAKELGYYGVTFSSLEGRRDLDLFLRSCGFKRSQETFVRRDFGRSETMRSYKCSISKLP